MEFLHEFAGLPDAVLPEAVDPGERASSSMLRAFARALSVDPPTLPRRPARLVHLEYSSYVPSQILVNASSVPTNSIPS